MPSKQDMGSWCPSMWGDDDKVDVSMCTLCALTCSSSQGDTSQQKANVEKAKAGCQYYGARAAPLPAGPAPPRACLCLSPRRAAPLAKG